MIHSNSCTNGCKYIFGSPWVCTHPNYIGRYGGGVGSTEMEKEFVKRMGCASYICKVNRFEVEDFYLNKIGEDNE